MNRMRLVFNLREIGGGLIFDIRYATDNNFMGEKFYETPGALQNRPLTLFYMSQIRFRAMDLE